MTSALSPREIQSRLRAGASVAEVAEEAGVEAERISGFALPVMAERAHVTRTALGASVRRRGDGSGHRRLGDLIHERLQARGLDADVVEWDSWRQSDLRWRLVGLLDDQAASRCAEFVYDPKGRFSVADNADARWMIGEELPHVADDPDNENTIDFHDEFAIVRAITDDAPSGTSTLGRPGDDVPKVDSPYEGSTHTSELDELYDMLSGVSEDSVRIYLGLEEADEEDGSAESVGDEADSSSSDAGSHDSVDPAALPLDAVSEGDGGEAAGGETRNQGSEESSPSAGEGPATVASATPDEPETRLADELSEHPELSTVSGQDPTDAAERPGDGVPGQQPGDGVSKQQPGHGGGGQQPGDGVAGQQPGVGGGGQQLAATAPASAPSPVAPEQDPLIQEGPPSSPRRTPAKKRASIPSWDEIMFGGPSRG